MKYLISNASSLKQLCPRLPQCGIYSFFIWNSSSKIERSLRGMYCSLLHQIITNKPEIADQLLPKHPNLLEHKSLFDWEVMELRSLLDTILLLHRQPICLFLDGLDEIDAQEDPLSLIETIQDMNAQNIELKICVSSRPEPIWNPSLNHLPSLRLQDLTKQDMRTTAKGLLNEYFPRFFHTCSEDCDR